MCVQTCKSGTLTRAEVLASLAGASLFAFGKPAHAAPIPHATPHPTPRPTRDPFLWQRNLRPLRVSVTTGADIAAGIARKSKLVSRAYGQLLDGAHNLADEKLRTALSALLTGSAPQYMVRLRSASIREKLRQDLMQASFIDRLDAIDAFLPGRENSLEAAPFFATAGSAQDSHHAYPGGLVLHEWFNARSALTLADSYNREYFGHQRTVNSDVVVASAMYHDVMKTVVFKWNVDGRLTAEPNIAGTGAHHILSAAEAIARGHDARFVTVVLSAHAAPSLGDEVKVVAWARAAAMVAGVDPVDYGLLKKKGDTFELAAPPPIECFISNLSDHDYVLSVHAMHEVAPRIDSMVAAGRVPEAARLWHRNALLANTSAIALYQTLATDEKAFTSQIDRELSKISL